MSDLEAAHSQVVFITGVSSEAQDSERDRSGGQSSQCQLPLAGIGLLQQGGELQNGYLEGRRGKEPSSHKMLGARAEIDQGWRGKL